MNFRQLFREAKSDLYYSLLIILCFICCVTISGIIFPETITKFFSISQLPNTSPDTPSHQYYWDARHYATLILGRTCSAFYPLWPSVVKIIFNPLTVDSFVSYARFTSVIIFLFTTPLLFRVFRLALNNDVMIAFIAMLTYTINPNTIFRLNGYTEGWFTLLSTIFIWALLPSNRLNNGLKLTILSGVAFLMGMSRSVVVQILAAGVGAILTISIFKILKEFNYSRSRWKAQDLFHYYKFEFFTTLLTSLSVVAGYTVYGFYCLKNRGDFFAPFADQQHWNKKLGIHPELLLYPKSLLFDFFALYYPLIFLAIALLISLSFASVQSINVFVPSSKVWNLSILYPPLLIGLYFGKYWQWKNRINDISSKKFMQPLIEPSATDFISNNYLFWFCTYFSVSHSLIIFFTQDRLFSLARYVFSLPFFFLTLGYLYLSLGKRLTFAIYIVIILSIVSSIIQWIDYGRNAWLG